MIVRNFARSGKTNMENNKDYSGIYIFAAIAVIAIYVMVIFAIGAALFAIGYQIYYIFRYEKETENAWGLMVVTGLVFIVTFSAGLTDIEYYDRSQDVGYLISGVIKLSCTAIPSVLYYLYRLLEPISPAVIKVIDVAHLSYSEQKITKNQRDELINFAKNSPAETVEEFVINGFTHTNNSAEKSYDDFEENTYQSQANNVKPDDEFSYNSRRFDDDRFTTPQKKHDYVEAYRIMNDPTAETRKRALALKFSDDADKGNIDGIFPLLPAPE